MAVGLNSFTWNPKVTRLQPFMRPGSKISIFRAGLVGAMVLVGAALPAGGASYQVGPGRLYKTLQNVAGLLGPGDQVSVDGGVTYTGGVTFRGSGTAGAPISITGVRVNNRRPMLAGVTGQGMAVLRILGSHYIISGFDLTTGGDSRAGRCFYNVGDDITLRDSIVHDCPMTGVAGADASGSLTLDRVEVCRCGNSLFAHQVYVGSSLAQYPQAVFRMQYCYVHDATGGNSVKSRVTRNVIEFNSIEGAVFHELDLVGPDPRSQAVPAGVHCDADVVGNVIVKTASSLGTVARFGSDGTGASNGRVRFINNTVIVRSKPAARSGLFWLKGAVDSVMVSNNVFWSTVGPVKLAIEEHGAAPVLSGSCNWWPAGTVGIPGDWHGTAGADPAFRDASVDDFRPGASSPLAGAGCGLPTDLEKWPAPTGVPPGKAARSYGSMPGRDIGAIRASGTMSGTAP
jgi:hypothetical protein